MTCDTTSGYSTCAALYWSGGGAPQVKDLRHAGLDRGAGVEVAQDHKRIQHERALNGTKPLRRRLMTYGTEELR